MTVLSPSRVTNAAQFWIRIGIPDQAEKPAPPILYLIKRRPSNVSWENTDFIPDKKWWQISMSSKLPTWMSDISLVAVSLTYWAAKFYANAVAMRGKSLSYWVW